MKPTAQLRRNGRAAAGEAGFSLTELVAGLLVASLLVLGLIDVTRRYARTTDRVKSISADIRDVQMLNALFREIERADVDGISLQPTRLLARVGDEQIRAELVSIPDNTLLQWTSSSATRQFSVPRDAVFERTVFGAIVLRSGANDPPLGIATPMRTTPFDCMFDTVSGGCR